LSICKARNRRHYFTEDFRFQVVVREILIVCLAPVPRNSLFPCAIGMSYRTSEILFSAADIRYPPGAEKGPIAQASSGGIATGGDGAEFASVARHRLIQPCRLFIVLVRKLHISAAWGQRPQQGFTAEAGHVLIAP
jgi:hypothetical protein